MLGMTISEYDRPILPDRTTGRVPAGIGLQQRWVRDDIRVVHNAQRFGVITNRTVSRTLSASASVADAGLYDAL